MRDWKEFKEHYPDVREEDLEVLDRIEFLINNTHICGKFGRRLDILHSFRERIWSGRGLTTKQMNLLQAYEKMYRKYGSDWIFKKTEK